VIRSRKGAPARFASPAGAGVSLALFLLFWITLSPAAMPGGIAFAQPGATCRDWRTVLTPHVPGGELTSVSASAKDNAWAVANFPDSRKPRTLHWDGSIWVETPHPTPSVTLESVEAISRTDVWVVGFAKQLFTEHWDGAEWTVIPAPSPADYDELLGVSAYSSTDVWAVGFFITDHTHPFAEHWDGSAWTLVLTPDQVAGLFIGVKAISPQDVWAVGYQDVGFADFQPLIEHWDGTAWTVVSAPPLAGTDNSLFDVSASSSTDVWAVGSYRPGTLDLPLTLHWNGAVWSQVDAPSAGDQGDLLEAVATVSPNDVWAVGNSYFSQDPTTQPLSLHWDGSIWTVRPAPSPGGESAGFSSVAASGPHDVWAVGVSAFSKNGYVIEHSRGPCPG
jgi:hypothetical protein